MNLEATRVTLPDVPLWRLCDAAALAGIGEKAFLAAVAAGDIPVAVLKVGRLRYVRSSELVRWLRPPATAEQSGSADCTDLFE